MDQWSIVYNSKCDICRKALDLLREKKIEPKIIEYLKNPPSIKTLNGLLKKLRVAPADIVRTEEPMYEKLGLGNGEKSRNDLLQAISEHPILLKRPIVIKNDRAVIAHPPELVMDFF